MLFLTCHSIANVLLNDILKYLLNYFHRWKFSDMSAMYFRFWRNIHADSSPLSLGRQLLQPSQQVQCLPEMSQENWVNGWQGTIFLAAIKLTDNAVIMTILLNGSHPLSLSAWLMSQIAQICLYGNWKNLNSPRRYIFSTYLCAWFSLQSRFSFRAKRSLHGTRATVTRGH